MKNSIRLDNNTVIENHTDELAPYFKVIRAGNHGTTPFIVEQEEFLAMSRAVSVLNLATGS